MTPTLVQNDFLRDLLGLQQDGKHAISAPANWTIYRPLLEVPTEVDGIISELCGSILQGDNGNETARWHFFVGSPGNGKSAAMGKLCRQLTEEKRCRVCDEGGGSISEIDQATIPYALDVIESDNRYASAQIVQDASVVRNPYSPDVNPARELLDTIKHAWDKGISLVICTNRGVLEKAHRDYHMDRDINSTPWFRVVTAIVSANTSIVGEIEGEREFGGGRTVFSRVKIKYSHLDNRSLLLGRETFSGLIQKATAEAHWTCCQSCPDQSMCPFRLNRDWLLDEEGRRSFLQLLTRAEVFSGQVIVFREALAIISLLLAGCPKDYDNIHPCDWVRSKIANNDIFSLATRRLYMSLFASYCPLGLEEDDDLRKKQLEGLRELRDVVGEGHSLARAAIGQVIEGNPPSTDVGVTRLLGEGCVITSLDPCREALPAEFYDRWDADYDAVPESGLPYFTDLERICISIWKDMEEALELTADYEVLNCHWALRRWSSNFLFHYGALREGLLAWAEELDRFSILLGLVAKAPQERSPEERRTIHQLDLRLESLLSGLTEDQSRSLIPLSESVKLAGEWVRDKLKPKTIVSEASGSVALAIRFEGGEKAVFLAPMYLWLTRKVEGKLEARCFPQELIAGISDARVRAAAKGKYAFANDDVELIIEAEDGEKFRLGRFDGEVDVTSEHTTLSENCE